MQSRPTVLEELTLRFHPCAPCTTAQPTSAAQRAAVTAAILADFRRVASEHRLQGHEIPRAVHLCCDDLPQPAASTAASASTSGDRCGGNGNGVSLLRAHEWTGENGLLTASLKPCRHRVCAHYSDAVRALFAAAAGDAVAPPGDPAPPAAVLPDDVASGASAIGALTPGADPPAAASSAAPAPLRVGARDPRVQMVLAAVVRRLGEEIEGSSEVGSAEEVAALAGELRALGAALVGVGEAAESSALTALVGDSLGLFEVA